MAAGDLLKYHHGGQHSQNSHSGGLPEAGLIAHAAELLFMDDLPSFQNT